ncbi:secondary thiamine-phosphate synthase enzyme YjbQ [Anaerosoma tenue]|uniref:secondary thiamine-phosphate synthase enzyme YjbQ n=1 Tax=Anaerosoma tenue TaxID=2933588 RepID=UPI0022608BFA|nr:secondary thiamine-phosphate synthase enzyme YjbQ [Anaerosoma tenue]MCK8115192.1 secondary thiamine-phosphate synthase enzyme YjbQ [Anaerosoma tenue]
MPRGGGGMRFEIQTQRREQMVEITREVAGVVTGSGVTDGRVMVFCQHTTAAVTINEAADPDVQVDMLAGLSRLVPEDGGWRHIEGNSDAHIKSSLVGVSVDIPIVGGRMALGSWQGVYLCEFDGPRRRSLAVVVSGV